MTVLKKKDAIKINEWLTEKRPTKLEIPNSNLGGDMDGMGDLDNAPMPPMGADDMGGGDQMGGPEDMGGIDDMGNEPMGGPDSMSGMDDMGGPEDMGGPDMGSDEDSELIDIINNLSIEDKAAVTKYAKSMVDDSNGSEEPMDDMQDMGGEMPTESRMNYKRIIDEVIEDMFDNEDGITRPHKEIPKEYDEYDFNSPFMNKNYEEDSY